MATRSQRLNNWAIILKHVTFASVSTDMFGRKLILTAKSRCLREGSTMPWLRGHAGGYPKRLTDLLVVLVTTGGFP